MAFLRTSCLVSLMVLLFLFSKGSAEQLSSRQLAMLDTLKQVYRIYTDHYAPLTWKVQQMGTDLNAEFEQIRQAILSSPNMSTKEFQNRIARFVSATRDYHASIMLYSTESSSLPITIASAEGKYFIVAIDRTKLATPAIAEGDEVIEFDGKPIVDVLANLRNQKYPNVYETDQRWAEMILTNRSRMSGHNCPTGSVQLTLKRYDKITKISLNWIYQPELVPEVPVRELTARTDKRRFLVKQYV